jgi:hypothetical protein
VRPRWLQRLESSLLRLAGAAAPLGWRPSLADCVMGTGLTDGAAAPPEVMDLRELIPTLISSEFPRIDASGRALGR